MHSAANLTYSSMLWNICLFYHVSIWIVTSVKLPDVTFMSLFLTQSITSDRLGKSSFLYGGEAGVSTVKRGSMEWRAICQLRMNFFHNRHRLDLSAHEQAEEDAALL
jgi:hypothetical protein